MSLPLKVWLFGVMHYTPIWVAEVARSFCEVESSCSKVRGGQHLRQDFGSNRSSSGRCLQLRHLLPAVP
jgi:hypothetical protein